ncbi:hypothetical protein D3C72_1860090 [compost metagenome]
MGAERRLDGGGHRHGAAGVIDRHHLRGGDAQRRTVWRVGNLNARWCAGFGGAHAVIADQGGAAGEVSRIDQAFDRDGHEVAIGQVLRAVGVGQSLGFGDQVHSLRGWLDTGREIGFNRCHRRQGQTLIASFQGLQRA